MARRRYLRFEEARKQERPIKQFCSEHPSEADRRALTVEALAKSDIRAIAETDMNPRHATLNELMD